MKRKFLVLLTLLVAILMTTPAQATDPGVWAAAPQVPATQSLDERIADIRENWPQTWVSFNADAVVMAPDEPMRLGVLAEGPAITLLANGEVLTQVQDDSFAEGGIALVSGTFEADSYESFFDNLELWALSQP